MGSHHKRDKRQVFARYGRHITVVVEWGAGDHELRFTSARQTVNSTRRYKKCNSKLRLLQRSSKCDYDVKVEGDDVVQTKLADFQGGCINFRVKIWTEEGTYSPSYDWCILVNDKDGKMRRRIKFEIHVVTQFLTNSTAKEIKVSLNGKTEFVTLDNNKHLLKENGHVAQLVDLQEPTSSSTSTSTSISTGSTSNQVLSLTSSTSTTSDASKEKKKRKRKDDEDETESEDESEIFDVEDVEDVAGLENAFDNPPKLISTTTTSTSSNANLHALVAVSTAITPTTTTTALTPSTPIPTLTSTSTSTATATATTTPTLTSISIPNANTTTTTSTTTTTPVAATTPSTTVKRPSPKSSPNSSLNSSPSSSPSSSPRSSPSSSPLSSLNSSPSSSPSSSPRSSPRSSPSPRPSPSKKTKVKRDNPFD